MDVAEFRHASPHGQPHILKIAARHFALNPAADGWKLGCHRRLRSGLLGTHPRYSPQLSLFVHFIRRKSLLPTEYLWVIERLRVTLTIKQHLRLRAFYGRSENSVRCQIWSAICAYLLVAILKKRMGVEKSLNEILQIASVGIFEQTPANIVFSEACETNTPNDNEPQSQKLLEISEI